MRPMEDADHLLLLALGRVGCSVPENVRCMADVIAEDALPAMCASCIRALGASREGAEANGTVSPSPEPFPTEAAARIRACEHLAERLNALARSEGAAPESHHPVSVSEKWTCVDVLAPAEATARDACALLLDALTSASGARRRAFRTDADELEGRLASRACQNERDARSLREVPSAASVLARVAELTRAVEKQASETRAARRAARAAAGDLASSRAALARSHALVDAFLYREAVKGDAISKETFKHFTVIHESFERLAADVDATWRETAEAGALDRRREAVEARVARMRVGNARLEAIVAEAKTERDA